MPEVIITNQNMYKAIFKKESIDIEATSKWAATMQARAYFKTNCRMRQSQEWMVTVWLTQLKGKEYIHKADF